MGDFVCSDFVCMTLTPRSSCLHLGACPPRHTNVYSNLPRIDMAYRAKVVRALLEFLSDTLSAHMTDRCV